MATIRLYPTKQVVVNRKIPEQRTTPGSTVTLRNSQNILSSEPIYVGHFELPDSLKWASIYGDTIIGVYGRSISAGAIGGRYSASVVISTVNSGFDFDTGTYLNLGSGDFLSSIHWSYVQDKIPSYGIITTASSSKIRSLVKYGFQIAQYEDSYSDNDNLVVDTGTGSNKPYIEFSYVANGSSLTIRNYSIPAIYNPAIATETTWRDDLTGQPIYQDEYIDTAHYILQWTTNTSTTPNEIEGTKTGATIPADTLPQLGTVYTRVKVVDPLENVTYSDWVETQSYKNIVVRPSDLNPSAGFINEKTANVFTWILNLAHPTTYVKELTLACSYELQWRPQNGSWQTIPASAGRATVPASTFSSANDLIEVRAVVENPAGVREYSAVATISLEDAISTAISLEPISTIKSDAEPITFRWQHSISTGTAQTAAELQWSSNLTEWNALASESGNANSKTIDLSGLPGGSIYWRVRTANSDGVFSAWSSPVSFIFVAAPPAPIVAVNPVPMSVISWQAQNQQAYEVELDGVSQGIKFGNASSFTVCEPLSDGTHTVSVRVQGAFSLWSTAATVTFNVVNSPGASVTASAMSGIDAFIVWETEATDAVFYVYRDNKLIGKTRDSQFTDRLTAGSHDYSVIAAFPSGYYSKSNTSEAESGSDSVMIADIEGGSWIDISRSPDSNSSQDFSWTLTNSIRHFAGAKLPVIEMSEFEDETAAYRTSISNTDDAKAFENLKGKICIVKSRRREVVIAALVRLKKSVENFFITYDFSMQRIHWEEITDETSS